MVLLSLLALSCATESDFSWNMDQGLYYFQKKRYAQAASHFEKAVKERKSDHGAQVAYANALMELANNLFLEAREMAKTSRGSEHTIRKAIEYQTYAAASFQEAHSLKPKDIQGWYGIGRLHYYRVSNPMIYAMAPPKNPAEDESQAWKEGQEARIKEIDQGIHSYRKVLEIDAETRYAHHDLGHLLILRGINRLGELEGKTTADRASHRNEARLDLEQARGHLKEFRDQLLIAVSITIARPVQTVGDQQARAKAIVELEKQLEGVTNTLHEYRASLREEEKMLSAKVNRTPDENLWKEWLARESLETDRLIRGLESEIGKDRSPSENN